jgi:3-deoxy-D-manno-octulosonic-acid transferase
MDHLLHVGLNNGRTIQGTNDGRVRNCLKVDALRPSRFLARMPPTSVAYRLFVHLGFAAARPLGAFDAKTRRGLSLRAGAVARLAAWAAIARDAARPLAWFHAPSVGEGLQARAVLEVFRRRHPDWQVAYTYFSPSAERFAHDLGADIAEVLPADRTGDVDAALDALRPDLLVFTKLDLWPELATRAAARGTRVALVAGTVRAGSGRLRWPVRALLAPGYAALARAGAVAADDAARLAALGVAQDRITLTGDPRHDSVQARVRAVPPDDPLLRFGGAPTLVAGSTWPPDEDVLLAAFRDVRARHPAAQLVLVPHEPHEPTLARIERQAAALSLPAPVRLSAATGPVPLLLVDRVGVLSALYGAGTCAFVGGGFGRAGLHSVLEPAAWGLPVAFGPNWRESRDAADLMREEAAVEVTTADAMATQWLHWIEDDAGRLRQGARARALVARGAGAAERSADLLDELLRG